jgi:hypothetical protein
MPGTHLEPLLQYAERRAVVVDAGLVRRSGSTSATRYWITQGDETRT